MRHFFRRQRNVEILTRLAALLIRLLGATLRFEFSDPSGLARTRSPAIWVFWHNRILMAPVVCKKYFSSLEKVVVLTSPSRDGEFIAGCVGRFGIDAERGSSSRRGAASLRRLTKRLADGWNVVITPDGPRGPRRRLQPGVIQLAELSGAGVIPVHIRFSRKWELRSWDGFQIPVPFGRAIVRLDETPWRVPPNAPPEERGRIRRELERAMREGDGDPPG